LAIWESIPEKHSEHEAARARIAALRADLSLSSKRQLEEARRLEAQGRLAEAILGYRLTLRLKVDDDALLTHIQHLAREKLHQAKKLQTSYAHELAAGDLESAWESLRRLRALDPFEAGYESEERALRAAQRAEWEGREERLRIQRQGEVETLAAAALEAFRAERLKEALALWQRALLLDPHNERVQSYVSRAERQLEALRRLGEEQRDSSHLRRLRPDS